MNYLLTFNQNRPNKISAIEFLEKHDISYEIVDLKTLTPELFYILLENSETGLDGLIKKSMIYKLQDLSLREAVELILKNPKLFLRDLYLYSENERGVLLLVGFNENDYRTLIPKQRRRIMLELAKEGDLKLFG